MDQRRAQVLVRLGETPFAAAHVHGKDACAQQELAHKIFVWDLNGVYQDAYFPYPRYGHFLNDHHTLKGAHVRDMFPGIVGCWLQATIHSAWNTQTPKSIQLVFERDGQHYEADVFCVPTQEGRVMGAVTDRPLVPRLATSLSTNQSPHSNEMEALLTTRYVTPCEKVVLAGVRLGRTNPEIGALHNMSSRAVRYHLENLFRKFRVSSRGKLACLE